MGSDRAPCSHVGGRPGHQGGKLQGKLSQASCASDILQDCCTPGEALGRTSYELGSVHRQELGLSSSMVDMDPRSTEQDKH